MGFTLYEVVFGHPPSLLQYVPKIAKVQAVENQLYDRDQVKKLLMDNLIKARDRMKLFANRHHTESSFMVGDRVLLKLQPYMQRTTRGSMLQKLSSKYYGPYTILKKIGSVAYRL